MCKVQCETGAYISDHCSVTLNIEAEKDDVYRKTITSRNSKNMNIDQFQNELKFNTEVNDLESLVSDFNNVVRNTLDLVAPVKTRTFTTRKSKDWFTEDLRTRRARVRRKERLFRRFRRQELWEDLKRERNNSRKYLFCLF